MSVWVKRRESSRRESRSRGMPDTPANQMPATTASEMASPTTNDSSSASPSESPRLAKPSCISPTRSLNSGPSLAPSNAVEPMALRSRAVVPAIATRPVAPTTGGRRTSAPVTAPAERGQPGEQPEPDAEARRRCATHGSTP